MSNAHLAIAVSSPFLLIGFLYYLFSVLQPRRRKLRRPKPVFPKEDLRIAIHPSRHRDQTMRALITEGAERRTAALDYILELEYR